MRKYLWNKSFLAFFQLFLATEEIFKFVYGNNI